MFDAYATIYQAIGQGQWSAASAERTLRRLPEPNRRRVLDLACGTGDAALTFAEASCGVTAVDCSPAMLEIARRKARRSGQDITFVQSDVRHLPTTDDHPLIDERRDDDWRSSLVIRRSSFDLITCFDDSLAYLTDDGDLDMLFADVALALASEGVFVFDTRAEEDYASWDERELVVYDGNEYFVYHQMNYEPETRRAVMRIVWFTRQDERWRRGEETHHLRMWSGEDIRDALEQAGLNVDSVERVTMANGERRFVWTVKRAEEAIE